MIDYLEIETTPSEESCVQVKSNEPYMTEMRKEAQRYAAMLKKRFADCDKVSIGIKTNPHDLGSYLSIKIKFDDSDDIAGQQAYHIENNLPQYWADNEIITFVPDDIDE